ncbi:MAG TPA: hypothetical protein VH440_11880 [Candidatus Limnocylindrales bacterium]|jgi:hypothetical protein
MTSATPAGLCATCRHARTVVAGRGSRFLLCERSRTDPAYPRYPRLPMLACAGFQPEADPLGETRTEPPTPRP